MRSREGFVRRLVRLVVLVVVAVAISGSVANAQKVITVAYGAEPGNLLPHASGGEASVRANMFDSLVRRDPRTLELVGGLAHTWEASEDGLRWTLHLREGVTFHNGEPFTAEDVKWTYDNRVLGENSVVKTQFKPIAELNVVDDYTIEIVTNIVFPLLPNYLASSFFVMPSDYFEEVGEEGFGQQPVGTGPFKFVEWAKNERIVMEANPSYFLGRPKIDRAIWRVIPETSTRLAELMSGGADIVMQVPPEHVPILEANPNTRVELRDSVRVVYFGIRTDREPLDDVRVRRALNLAINQDELVDAVLEGQAYQTSGPLAPMVFGYTPDVEGHGYDPDEARRLLAEAGYPDGFTITLEAPVGRYLKDKEVAEWVAGELAKIGVEANLRIFEWGQYLEKYRGHTFGDIYMLGWGGTAYDADFVFSNLFHSDNFRSYYSNPEVDRLIEEARATVDPDERLRYYRDLSQMVVDDAAWINLFGQKDAWGLSERVNWSPGQTEYLWLHDVDLK